MANSIVIQFKRGTTAQNDLYTGRAGSISYDTELHDLRVHDGTTPGGYKILNSTEVQNLITTSLGGDNVVNSVAGKTGTVTLQTTDLTDFATVIAEYAKTTDVEAKIATAKSEATADATAAAKTETESQIKAAVTDKLGVASGIATLDVNGKLESSQIPAIAISSVTTVADDAARDKLTEVQEGDFVIVTHEADETPNPRTYIRSADNSWIEITTGNSVLSVAGKTGVVTLSKADVGLDKVENYAIATAEEAAAISAPSNEVYMTPQRTVEMFAAMGISVVDGEATLDLGTMA